MALPGEVLGVETTVCEDCSEILHIQVLSSAAGYYVGFFCPQCGPYGRESGYYKTRGDAQAALDAGSFGR